MLALLVLAMSDESSSEKEWIRKAKRGDRNAFGQLTREFLPRVYQLCRKMGLSHDEADDMTQETFIKAYQALERFEEGRPFWNWIARIANNNVINYLKRKRREIGGEEGDGIVGQQAASATASNPHTAVVAREMETRVEQAIEKLPHDFRVVYLMRMQLDYSYEAIAATLAIPVGTVMSRLKRARDRLLDDLKDLLER